MEPTPSYMVSFGRRVMSLARDSLPGLVVVTLLLLMLVTLIWQRIFISIHSGEAGVHWKRFGIGTIIEYVYPEGMHVIPPWDTMHIYNARVQTVLHEFDVLTNRGLPIHLRIAIRYVPVFDMIAILHQQVGPNYVNVVVIPQVESVLRKSLGKHNPEDIYTNKDGVLTNILVSAIEETGQKFIRIDDIIIRSMDLPPPVRQAIEDKLIQEQRDKAYEFLLAREKKEAARKLIEAGGIRDYQSTIAQTLTKDLLLWQGVQATLKLSESNNAKVVVIGSSENGGLPLILNPGN